MSVYEHSLKREFLGEKEFEETLEEGKRILDEWYELSKDHLIVPAELEYSFFGRSSILEDIPLTAKIDKIEWVDKKASLVKVIDYKTGTAKGRGQIAKPVDGGEESNYYRQLVFYKLISDITPSFPYKVIESELEFVKPNKGKITKVSFQIPDSDIKALKEIIREVMEKIRNLEF